MVVVAVPGRSRPAARRRAALALLSLTAALLVVAGGPAGPAAAADPSLDELRLKQAEAAGDLEDSSEAVRAAGAQLRSVQGRLVAARSEVAKARGQLAGARAKAAAALAEVERAEDALREARAEVDAATERVQAGRDDVGRLARRAYQRGRLDDLRQVMEGEPQEAVTRAGLLRSVFRFRNSTLTRLTEDRLALAGTVASLAADQRALDDARAVADAEAARARAIAERSQAAQAEVEALAAQQAAVLAQAEKHRAQDARDYEAARAASQALAERIRAAAARAEAARVAAAKQAAAEAAKAAAAAEAERRRRAAAGQRALAAPAPPRVSSTGMVWPAPGRLTSRFGIRVHPIFGDARFHAGIDIGGGMGAQVRAARDGYVTYAGYASGYGTLVVVSHGTVGGRDLSTAYAHLSSISVNEGESVSQGQRVGGIGDEGNSTGPHLHFEVRRDGEPVDPLDWVSPP